MRTQKGKALCVFNELNATISIESLEDYLKKHHWNLCYYGDTAAAPGCMTPVCEQSAADEKKEPPVPDQIIHVAELDDYAPYVPSFAYRFRNYRGVFINKALRPSESRIIHLILHEIGHIIYKHKPVSCILGKGNDALEKTANDFMKQMLKLQAFYRFKNFALTHKIKTAIICSMLLISCCCSGFQLSRAPASDAMRPASVSNAAANSFAQSNPDIHAASDSSSPGKTPDSRTAAALPPSSKTEPVINNTPPESASGAAAAAGDIPPAQTAVPSPVPVQLDPSTIVYVAKTGSVYHLFMDCSYIKGKDGVTELPVAYAGNKSICSRCKSRFMPLE